MHLFAVDDSPYIALVRNWPLWLPLFLGGASVYLLLPRPRPFSPWLGGVTGLVALILAGVLWFRPVGLNPEAILFYSFSALAVGSGVLLVTQQNPARAALSFTLVVLSTSGLFLLLAAPFLMAATIIVYAGAIIVTFLFVIMLAQQHGYSDADARSREPALAVLTGFLLLAVLLHVIRLANDNGTIDALLAEVNEFEKSGKTLDANEAGQSNDTEKRVVDFIKKTGDPALGVRAENATQLAFEKAGDDQVKAAALVMQELRSILTEMKETGSFARPGHAMSGMSGVPANTPPGEVRRDPETGLPRMPADNAAHLGKSLFTDYLLPVQLGGLLLLVATVGAIAISHRRQTEQAETPSEERT